MARPAPGRDEDNVKAGLKGFKLRSARPPQAGSPDHASALARRDRIGGLIERRTGFDFDKRQDFAPERDKIDLPSAGAYALV